MQSLQGIATCVGAVVGPRPSCSIVQGRRPGHTPNPGMTSGRCRPPFACRLSDYPHPPEPSADMSFRTGPGRDSSSTGPGWQQRAGATPRTCVGNGRRRARIVSPGGETSALRRRQSFRKGRRAWSQEAGFGRQLSGPPVSPSPSSRRQNGRAVCERQRPRVGAHLLLTIGFKVRDLFPWIRPGRPLASRVTPSAVPCPCYLCACSGGALLPGAQRPLPPQVRST